MNPLQSLRDYEKYVYTLSQKYPSIGRSTLTVVRRSSATGRLAGELEIGDYRLVVREKLSFEDEIGPIQGYGYEVWRGTEKLYWYDSQAHPNDPALASTHPHHKHVHPDIKHNRIPAPGLSFTEPNLPFLIEEIMQLLTE
ncbi:MAG: DUF6516 family protein [Caldilineaceae bacterium]